MQSARLADGLRENCRKAGVGAVVNRVGSMMTLFFTDLPSVTDWNTAKNSNTAAYGRYFHESLQTGVYRAPSQFEALFVSAAHSDDDIETSPFRPLRQEAAHKWIPFSRVLLDCLQYDFPLTTQP